MEPNTKTRTAAKIAATIGALGLAVAALTGAFGAWTATETETQPVTAGVVDFANGTSLDVIQEFGPFAPGDSGVRTITVANGNEDTTLDIANVRLRVGVGTVSGAGSDRATTFLEDIAVTVEQCTTEQRTSCTAVPGASGTLAFWDTPRTLSADLPRNEMRYYKLTYLVSEQPAADTAGAAASLTWTLTGDPRAPITTR